MKSFKVDRKNNITAFAKRKNVGAASETFCSEAELGELAAAWHASRLVKIWNRIPALCLSRNLPIKTAILRIWKAIQRLDDGVTAHGANLTSDGSPAPSRYTRAENKLDPLRVFSARWLTANKPPYPGMAEMWRIRSLYVVSS